MAFARNRHTVKSNMATILSVLVLAFLGVFATRVIANTVSVTTEAEDGVLAGCASSEADQLASNTRALHFTCPANATKGAVLPISYDISALTGTTRYVSTTGNDTTGNGSVNAPYATLAKAYSVAVANDSIVIRGGTYRQGNLTISASKPVKILAYPNEVPVFNGAQVFATGWVSEGAYQYHAYTPQPVTDGSGISFTTGQNLTGDGVGKFPDQAWVGTSQLRQVTSKAAVVDGTFWVDSTNNRIYLTAADVAKGNVEVSERDNFVAINAKGVKLEGLRITRFSNSANDYGVIKFIEDADRAIVRNIEVSDTSFIAVSIGGTTRIHNDTLFENVTIANSNWMGINPVYTNNAVFRRLKISNLNQFNEFTTSPQSGAIKTSRTWYTKVIDSDFSNNKSHALWFDQSNYKIEVAGNTILDNSGTGMFFEISDDILLINNLIRSSGSSGQPVKLAGSSGLKLINNTIIGGNDPVGVYTDNRSIVGCSDPTQPLCANSYSSDRDTLRTRPATMDWIPRIDLMVNNIIAYPSRVGFCGSLAALCITQTNATATVPLQNTIHQADATRGIPQTVMNYNVYANGTGRIIGTSGTDYTTVQDFMNAMSLSPVSISGLEALSKYGNSWVNTDGTPTATLAAAHNQAYAIPIDAIINAYVPAGTKHYGTLID